MGEREAKHRGRKIEEEAYEEKLRERTKVRRQRVKKKERDYS